MSSDKSNYYKEYFAANKEKLQEKIKCVVCGVSYMKCNKSHHEKSKRHKNAELEEKVRKMENGEIVEREENLKKKDVMKAINEMKRKIDILAKSLSE